MKRHRCRVAVMGPSGAGKTAMRGVLFSRCSPAHTARLGRTRAGANPVPLRVLNSLVLTLLDCGGGGGGEEASSLTNLSALVYVLDVNAVEDGELQMMAATVLQVSQHSPRCRGVFVLLNKAGEANNNHQEEDARLRVLARLPKLDNDAAAAFPVVVQVLLTSIFRSSLHVAWGHIVRCCCCSLMEDDEGLTWLAKQLAHVLGDSVVAVSVLHKDSFLVLGRSTADDEERGALLPHRLMQLRAAMLSGGTPVSIEVDVSSCATPPPLLLEPLSPNTLALIESAASPSPRKLKAALRAFRLAKRDLLANL